MFREDTIAAISTGVASYMTRIMEEQEKAKKQFYEFSLLLFYFFKLLSLILFMNQFGFIFFRNRII